MGTWGERRKVGCSKEGQSMVACREAFVDMASYMSLAPTLLSKMVFTDEQNHMGRV